MPAPEHHRDRLLRQGATALTDAELIATLLRTGDQNRSALRLAQDLLDEIGGLQALRTTNGRLLRLQGIGPAKASVLLAAIETARRLARTQVTERVLLDQPSVVAGYVSLRYLRPDQEVTGCLYLDARNRLIADSEIFRGTIHRTAIEPRAILKEALLYCATGFILFHSHPSGDPTPSRADQRFTRRLADAGDLMGIRLIDHVIVGSARDWISLRRRGTW